MDEDPTKNQESEEIKNLEEELKTLGKTQEGLISTVPPPGAVPVPSTQTIQQPPPQIEPSQPPPPTPRAPQSQGSKMLMAAIGLLILSLLGAGAYFLGNRNLGPKACTEEAKLCPDGSSVGR